MQVRLRKKEHSSLLHLFEFAHRDALEKKSSTYVMLALGTDRKDRVSAGRVPQAGQLILAQVQYFVDIYEKPQTRSWVLWDLLEGGQWGDEANKLRQAVSGEVW